VLLGVDVDVAITIGISHNLLIVKFLLFSDVIVMHFVIVIVIVAMLTMCYCCCAAVLVCGSSPQLVFLFYEVTKRIPCTWYVPVQALLCVGHYILQS